MIIKLTKEEIVNIIAKYYENQGFQCEGMNVITIHNKLYCIEVHIKVDK